MSPPEGSPVYVSMATEASRETFSVCPRFPCLRQCSGSSTYAAETAIPCTSYCPHLTPASTPVISCQWIWSLFWWRSTVTSNYLLHQEDNSVHVLLLLTLKGIKFRVILALCWSDFIQLSTVSSRGGQLWCLRSLGETCPVSSWGDIF